MPVNFKLNCVRVRCSISSVTAIAQFLLFFQLETTAIYFPDCNLSTPNGQKYSKYIDERKTGVNEF